MIVVEGPDGAGKTTLIETISAYLDIPVAPRVVSKDTEAMVDLVEWVENNVKGGFQRTIFDRHRLISEPIYGPTLRTKLEPGFDDPSWFFTQLSRFYDLDPIVIYCLPPFSRVWRNVQHDSDNKVVAHQHTLQQIWGAYFSKAMTDHVLRNRQTWVYDYTHSTAPMIERALITNIQTTLNAKRANNVRIPE